MMLKIQWKSWLMLGMLLPWLGNMIQAQAQSSLVSVPIPVAELPTGLVRVVLLRDQDPVDTLVNVFQGTRFNSSVRRGRFVSVNMCPEDAAFVVTTLDTPWQVNETNWNRLFEVRERLPIGTQRFYRVSVNEADEVTLRPIAPHTIQWDNYREEAHIVSRVPLPCVEATQPLQTAQLSNPLTRRSASPSGVPPSATSSTTDVVGAAAAVATTVAAVPNPAVGGLSSLSVGSNPSGMAALAPEGLAPVVPNVAPVAMPAASIKVAQANLAPPATSATPTTPLPPQVANLPTKKITIDSDILFPFASYDLNEALDGATVKRQIARQIGTINWSQVKYVRVIGHSDSVGMPHRKEFVSGERARAVAQFLMKEHQVPLDKIEARAMADRQLIVNDCPTKPKERADACNLPNRRVEIVLVGS